jgi:hypothetical protein
MSGLDDLILVLDFIIGGTIGKSMLPPAIMEAYQRLLARQANHQTFDEPVPEIEQESLKVE